MRPPSSFNRNLKVAIDPSYSGGILESASCNKSTSESVCVATGDFCSGDPCTLQLPLLAVSSDKGNNWTYPPSIFQNLTTIIDPNFAAGELVSSSCTGSGNQTVCIASGRYFNNPNTFPLLALTTTGGSNWVYPAFIHHDLATKIGHDLNGGYFKGAACTGLGKRARCIATGAFTTTKGVEFPLVALTKDGGQNWTFPPFFYTKLKTLVDPNSRRGVLNAATCIAENKESICMAAGNYCTDKICSKSNPLIAVTTDGGKTWSYPPSVFQNLNTVIDPNMTRSSFSAISCSGVVAKTFCVATGQFETPGATFPLLAYSTDKGATWTYPSYIFKNLTTSVNPDFTSGLFNNGSSTGIKTKSFTLVI